VVQKQLSSNILLAEKLQKVGPRNEEIYQDLTRDINAVVKASPALVHACLKAIKADGDEKLFFSEMRKCISWGAHSFKREKYPEMNVLSARHPLHEQFYYSLKNHTIEELYRAPVLNAHAWLEEEMHQQLQKLRRAKAREAGLIYEIPLGGYEEEEFERLKEMKKAFEKEKEQERREVVVTAEELIEAMLSRMGREKARIKYLSVDTHLVDLKAWEIAYRKFFDAWSLKKEEGRRKKVAEGLLMQHVSNRVFIYITSDVNDKVLGKIEDYLDKVREYNHSKAYLESQNKKTRRLDVIQDMADRRPEFTEIDKIDIYRAEVAVNALLENLEKGIFPGQFAPN